MLFCREKWFKNPIPYFWRNTFSSIRDRDNNVRTDPGFNINVSLVFINKEILSRDAQDTTILHCITRIQTEVH
jgi:hypothetical protein